MAETVNRFELEDAKPARKRGAGKGTGKVEKLSIPADRPRIEEGQPSDVSR